MSRLTEPVNLRDFLETGVTFQVNAETLNDEASDSNSDTEELSSRKVREQMVNHANSECVVQDDDTYEDQAPFERLAKKMIDLLPNGKIKKRVLREGDGDKPNDLAKVTIDYNAYTEYEEIPFDSTYARHRPCRFTINDGRVIAGLDFGVRSMRLNEKSQFLIHPDYAYQNCNVGRIPPDSTVLFEVELREIVDSGAALTYEQLPEEKQKEFGEIYKYCMALCEQAKSHVKAGSYTNAIRSYNMAVCKIEDSVGVTKEEIEQHQELSLRLYTNLLVCYTRNGVPKKGIMNADKIYMLTGNGKLRPISAKAYFNHARCLRMLGDYDKAKAVLKKAYELEPKNPEINDEFFRLEDEKLEYRKNQLALGKALVGGHPRSDK